MHLAVINLSFTKMKQYNNFSFFQMLARITKLVHNLSTQIMLKMKHFYTQKLFFFGGEQRMSKIHLFEKNLESKMWSNMNQCFDLMLRYQMSSSVFLVYGKAC